MSVCLSVCLSVYLCIFLSVCLSFCVSICVYVYLSISVSVHPSKYLDLFMRSSECFSAHVISSPSVHARDLTIAYALKSVSDSSILCCVAFAELLLCCLPRLQTGGQGQP